MHACVREEAALAAAQNFGHANSRILNYPHELDNRGKEMEELVGRAD